MFAIVNGDTLEAAGLGHDACHRERVHIATVAQGEGSVGALDHEAEPLVQGDRPLVVGEDVQLDPAQAYLPVRELESCLHERCPRAKPLPVVADRHPDLPDVSPAGPVRDDQAQLPDHLAFDLSHEAVYALGWFREESLRRHASAEG